MIRRRTASGLPTVAALLCLSATSGAVRAVEVERVEVTKNDDMYRVQTEIIVAAPADFIYDILLDFNDFHRLSGGMVTTRYLPPDDRDILMGYTLVNSCVWVFCKRFEKVERMWPVSRREIVTIADPERSDFVFYTTRWRLEETTTGTRLRFDAAMEPDFWVPPMLGLWAVKRKLAYTVAEIGERVEYLHATGTPLADLPATSDER